MNVGQRIKERRKELGISVDEMAEKLGICRTTLFRYESGQIEKVPFKNLIPIAKILNTTVEHLMGWDETDEAQLSTIFRHLPEEKKNMLLQYAKFLEREE